SERSANRDFTPVGSATGESEIRQVQAPDQQDGPGGRKQQVQRRLDVEADWARIAFEKIPYPRFESGYSRASRSAISCISVRATPKLTPRFNFATAVCRSRVLRSGSGSNGSGRHRSVSQNVRWRFAGITP